MTRTSQTEDETQEVAAVLKMTARGVESVRLRTMLQRWQGELKRSEEKRKRLNLVLSAVIEGYDSIDDIAAHTHLPRSTVYLDLITLAGQKRIEIRKAESSGKRPKNRYIAK